MATVVVGLSGGVDSSVAAHLLKEQGHHVIGLFMRNWNDESVIIDNECPWIEDSNDALQVAELLNIPFQVLDFSKEYKERIVDYMFSEYKNGRTPNPDVLCNREVKFDLFLKKAMELGADYVATGHYCRKETILKKGVETHHLLAGKDGTKDQSYFLCQVNQEQLSKALFPIGDLKKTEVRALAKKIGLNTAEKKDSQGLCFIGKVKLPVFLQQQLKPKKGKVIEIDRNHPIEIPLLDWSSQSTWMYSSGRTVDVAGTLSVDNDTWELSGSSGSPLCVLPSDDDIEKIDTWNGKGLQMRGRLVWNTATSAWCLDKSGESNPSLEATKSIDDLLLMLSANPTAVLDSPGQHYMVSAYMKYALEPSVEDESGYFVDSSGYTPGWTSIAVTIPGPRSTWLEAGQAVVANVTIAWDDENMRAELLVHSLEEGQKASPMNLLWSDGAVDWGYDQNKIVRVNGLAMEENGTWYLSEPGSEKRILLDAVNNCIGLDELHLGTAMAWEGRLLQVEDAESVSMVYTLSNADVDDNDNDGLSDALESAFGTSSNSGDSDGDGIGDRQEYIDQS